MRRNCRKNECGYKITDTNGKTESLHVSEASSAREKTQINVFILENSF